jgi:hypothetical protein
VPSESPQEQKMLGRSRIFWIVFLWPNLTNIQKFEDYLKKLKAAIEVGTTRFASVLGVTASLFELELF